jgi:hypothetical protein
MTAYRMHQANAVKASFDMMAQWRSVERFSEQ